ncbi:16795_t:CDS:2, partial [Cetraspora pellucida]
GKIAMEYWETREGLANWIKELEEKLNISREKKEDIFEKHSAEATENEKLIDKTKKIFVSEEKKLANLRKEYHSKLTGKLDDEKSPSESAGIELIINEGEDNYNEEVVTVKDFALKLQEKGESKGLSKQHSREFRDTIVSENLDLKIGQKPQIDQD